MDGLSYLYERIYRQLSEEIASGKRKPGDKLPTEQELCEQYKVSRITSKRAMNLLAQKGLIVRRRGLGSFVADVREGAPLKHLPRSGFSLKQPSARRIGLIMEDLGESYALNLFYQLDHQAAQLGLQLCLGVSYGSQQTEREVLHQLLGLGVKGLLVMPAHGQFYDTDLLRLVLDHFPLVLLDRALNGIPAPAIHSDNKTGGRLLTEHLLNKGHRNIAFLTASPEEALSLEDRYLGYEKAMVAAGLQPRQPVIVPGLKRFGFQGPQSLDAERSNERFFLDWLHANPQITAVIGSEFGIAHLVQKAASELGRPIPASLAICCFDEKYGYLGEYTFTHIRQDEEAIAAAGLDVLCQMLEGKNMRRQTHLLPVQLLQGAST